MKNIDDSMEWIPLWIDKWIFGATRIELQPDERAVWTDFMALAAKDNGHIRANPITPYPSQQLSGLLCISEELLARSLKRFIETKKIEEIFIKNENVEIFAGYRLINWVDYQLSERHKRRFEQAKKETDRMSKKTDTMSPKIGAIGYKEEDIKKRRGEESLRGENNLKDIISSLSKIKEMPNPKEQETRAKLEAQKKILGVK